MRTVQIRSREITYDLRGILGDIMFRKPVRTVIWLQIRRDSSKAETFFGALWIEPCVYTNEWDGLLNMGADHGGL